MQKEDFTANSLGWAARILPAAGPFLLLGIYLATVLLLKGKIPSEHELIASVTELYRTHGYLIIFLGAFFESTFLVSLYIPGATVVILGAALSRTGVISFPHAIGLAIVGFVLGYTINYFLGQHGWYHILSRLGLSGGLDIAKNKLKKHGVKTILFGYFYPSSATFISTAAGILRMPFGKFFFLSLIAQTFWSLVWGGLAYAFGVVFVELFIKYFTVIVVGVGVVWFVVKIVRMLRNRLGKV